MKKTALLSHVFACLTVFSCLGTAASRGDDWGPMLNPPQPEAFDVAEALADDDYRPNKIVVPRSKSVRKLPSPQRTTTAQPSGGLARNLESVLRRNEVIMPSRFLEESEVPAGTTGQTVRKTRPPSYVVETDAMTTTPKRTAAPSGEVYYEGNEIPVDDYQYLAETEYPLDGSGGLYNELSPALQSNYLYGPMVKPFGMGILDNLTVFGGVTGFRSVLDAGTGGNFGFSEGINWSGPATPHGTLSAQLGFRAVQANVNGSDWVDKSSRERYFFTAGIFRRDLSSPIQGGIAYDWMQDDYFDKVEVQQIRVELSIRTFSNLEYGFMGGFGVDDDHSDTLDARENAYRRLRNPEHIDTTYKLRGENYYTLFGRKHFVNGGLGELCIGLTEKTDFVLAGKGEFPVNDYLSLNGGFTALIPKDGRGKGGWRREMWDVSVGVIFYFRGGACSKPCNPCRPMFDVAGNGSFMPRVK